MSTEQNEAEPNPVLHRLARHVVVPVLTVVTVNHLLEGVFHRLKDLPGDLPEMMAHVPVGIVMEIIVSGILAILAQFSLATIVRGAAVTSVAILGYSITSPFETLAWRDAVVIGGGLGLLFFTPMLEVPYQYIMYRDRLAKEEEEIEEERRYDWLPTVAFPASWLDGTFLGFLYALTLAVYAPIFFGLTVYYLHVPPIRAAVAALLIPTVLGVAGIGLASKWLRSVEERKREERRRRQTQLIPSPPPSPEPPLDPEAVYAEHKEAYDAFVRGVKIATAAVVVIVICLALFLL
jgi:hypothetical protein